MILFESLVSFIFRIDLVATHETIIAVLFCLFSSIFLLLLESNIHIWIAMLSWFYLVLVSVPQESETKGRSV
jgi:hypothetical protein